MVDSSPPSPTRRRSPGAHDRLAGRIEKLDALRLEAAARADERITAVAHELRAPLAPLRAAADLLLKRAPVDAALARDVGALLLRQVTHMSALIDDLLDAAVVARGCFSVAAKPLRIRGVLEDAIEQARPGLDRRRQALVLELDPQADGEMEGDRLRLVQAFANLLDNAVKFTPDGGAIRVAATSVDHGAAIEVDVSDSGIGLDATMLARVFEAYFQVAPGAEGGSRRSGIGLGLALVRSIVESHGGSVHAVSDGLRRGTTMRVRLPKAAARRSA